MKRQIAILILAAMLLALACPAFAEEAAQEKQPWEIPVTNDELLGVWKPEDNARVTLLILPNSYTPTMNQSKLPELYVEGVWEEDEDLRVGYLIQLNRRKSEDNSLLSSLFGASVANAIKVIDFLSNGEKDSSDYDIFDYSHAFIGAEWARDGDFYQYTDNGSGSFYAIHDNDMSVLLYWMDSYDPHVAGMELRRVKTEAPSVEAITKDLLRPVIDMADDTQAQTAMTLIRWAADNRCMRMDGAGLTENLRAALAILEPADAQAFRDNYARISDLMIDALKLNPDTWSDPERGKSFKDAGLEDELSKINAVTENQRAMEILNDTLAEVMG